MLCVDVWSSGMFVVVTTIAEMRRGRGRNFQRACRCRTWSRVEWVLRVRGEGVYIIISSMMECHMPEF